MRVRAFLLAGFLLVAFAAVAQAKGVKRKGARLPEKTPSVAEAPAAAAAPSTEIIDPIVPQSLDAPADIATEAALMTEASEETAPQDPDFAAKVAVESAVAAAVSGEDAAQIMRMPADATASETKKPLAEAKPAAVASASTIAATPKESEIPVLAKATEKVKVESSPYPRVLMSFFIIALVAGGLVYFSRWYSRSTKKSMDTNRIRVLNQHFFGPKKSLAIVRVAGETVLVGITDQNISLLKSLSLLDEELPEATPARFASAMTAADRAAESKETDENPDDFLIGGIKDKISAKLKGMRNI